jgi:hypothetical protein
MDGRKHGAEALLNNLDRRRSPRVAVEDHRHLPAALRDVSLGGFSLELPEELGMGTVHDFDLKTGPRRRIVVRARVAHSAPATKPSGRTVFVTGLEFLADMTPESREALRRTA